jgi:general secretion pathway protein L
VSLLAVLAEQEIFRRFQEQFFDPLKACFTARLGSEKGIGGKLRVAADGICFTLLKSGEGYELSSLEQENSGLKAFLGRNHISANSAVQIEIDPQLVLVRRVRLPLAAKRNLVNVVGYEMDRLSPFEANEVYYHFTPLEQNEKGGWLEGRLVVVQKSRLDPWYRIISELGLSIDRVTLAGEEEPLKLKPKRVARSRVRSRAGLFLWGASVLLFSVAAGSTVWQQRQIAIDLEHKMESARVSATQSMLVEERLSHLRKAVSMVSVERQNYLSMSDLLLELTRLIPDNSWLQRITLSANELILSGMSEQASELIALLEASPLFESVRFKSPVVQDRRSGKEKFDLSLKLSQEPVE